MTPDLDRKPTKPVMRQGCRLAEIAFPALSAFIIFKVAVAKNV
ncbi:MAG: hypothetical protein ACEQSU_01300 [Microgenomates group bacterium]|jgi:hypothetical protein